MQNQTEPQIKNKFKKSNSNIETNTETNQSKINQLLNITELSNNKKYQETIKQITQSLLEFDQFTENLDTKVDGLLISQQNQFVKSYKEHMKKVESEFKVMEDKAQEQNQLIKYYENQGKMSNLIKKVAALEEQSKKLYAVIDKQQKQIKVIELENKIQKQQNKRLTQQIKEIIKVKNQLEISLSEYKEKQEISQNHYFQNNLNEELKPQKKIPDRFFTTQVQNLKRDLSITTDDNKKNSFICNMSEKSMISPSENTIKRKLADLTVKNRKLAKINTKILSERSELEQIFVNSVSEIKKQIIMKKKIKQCTYEDFKKQDKVNLLLTIISNEEILRFIYERIFCVKDIPIRQTKCYSLQKQYSTKVQTSPIQNSIRFSTSTNVNLRKGKKQLGILPYL